MVERLRLEEREAAEKKTRRNALNLKVAEKKKKKRKEHNNQLSLFDKF